MSDALPTLWQIDVSHYSEKARWALAWKGVAHRRHSPPPGAHMIAALWLTRGARYTFPILSLDGRRIGDSTAIIAALEELYPEPRLYPVDATERLRALALEDYFDEELGPAIRLYGWHEFGKDRKRFEALMKSTAPGVLAKLPPGLTAAYARAFTALRFRAGDPEKAELARAKILASLDRLEAELGDSEYLVGDRFSVADLTAASLFYPLARPEEGPMPADQDGAAGFEAFRQPLLERPGVRWVKEMFRRHRTPASATTPAATRS